MAVRRPNFTYAAAELGFILVSGALGYVYADWVYFVGIAAAGMAYWLFTRRNALASMSLNQRFIQGAIAIAMMIGILAIAFAVGLMIKGDPA